MSAPCPSCGGMRESDGRSCSCGWRIGKQRGSAPEIDLTCPWNDHGHICGERGSMSDGMNGAGPWYCSTHYWRLKKWAVATSQAQHMSYRERWYLERGLPYEPPKSGNAADLVPKRRTG